MNRNRFACVAGLLVAAGLLLAVGGCGPGLKSPEFGTILREIPKVPGADKPYPMPQLDEPQSVKEDAGAQKDSVDAQEPGGDAKSVVADGASPTSTDSAEPPPNERPEPPQEPRPESDENQSDSTTESKE